MQYDRNGNIKGLQRNGASDGSVAQGIDILTYTYDPQKPNVLRKVMDASLSPQGFYDDSDGITDPVDDYAYDDFGNMTADQNKNITEILYNQLNLPTKITFGSLKRKIDYLYTANGKKVRKNLNSRDLMEIGSIDYLDGFQYRDGWLQFFPTSEGYVRATVVNGTTAYSYVYNYTDHLGNIRLSYAQDPASPTELKILEENHYYPYGLKHTNYNSDLLVHREYRGALGIKDPGPIEPLVPVLPYNYKYNGKELQDEMGLNAYAYGWRDYDPAIGRFHKIDRFAEKYYNLNPYQYGANNPIIYNDIKGDSIAIYSPEDNGFIKYENGNLYSKNSKGKWEIYNGKNVKIDKNGSSSIGGFLGKVLEALDKIRNGNAGSELINVLQNASKYIRIYEGENGASGIAGNVWWNPLNTTGGPNQLGNTFRPAYIGLTHELGHVFDGLDGVVNNMPIGYIEKNVTASEYQAMHWENRVRGENGLPLRTHYGNDINGRAVGQALNLMALVIYILNN